MNQAACVISVNLLDAKGQNNRTGLLFILQCSFVFLLYEDVHYSSLAN